jgi:hypothetical protein
LYLHHDSAPNQKALFVRQTVSDPKIDTGMEHSPCSPDFALNDLLLFPKINSALKE